MADISQPLLFDSHCHLDSPQFSDDTQAIIQSARHAGVKEILIIGIDADNSSRSRDLAHRFGLRFTAGIHPHDADSYTPADLLKIAELASDPLCVAIGEIGLDYYRNYAAKDNQKKLLNEMLSLASDLKLPIVLHQRSVGYDVIDLLDRYDLPAGGVFHCFSDEPEHALEGIKRGYYISFAGNVTYKKSSLLEIACQIPLDRLLIETDAPYLTPHPFRGKRNEPAYVAYTANVIAEARNISLNDLASITRENGKRLFGWD